jgi:hypothetical protein
MRTNRISIVLAAALAFAFAGCQSLQPAGTSQTLAARKAVVITGGNGGGTTIYLPSDDGKDVVLLSDGKSAACPDCKNDAIKYFQAGKLEPKCSSCGATRSVLTQPQSSPGHN